MDEQLLQLLVSPGDGSELTLHAASRDAEGRIEQGELTSGDGQSWPIIDGVPRFSQPEDAGQQQTENSFGFKWNRRDTFDSPAMVNHMRKWIVQKYGFADEAELHNYFASRKRVLDAGCGAALSSSTFVDQEWLKGQAEWVGGEISNAIDVARSRLGELPRTHFVQADLMQMPFRPGTFDTIFSEGVLHHTPSTRDALHSVSRLLAPGGEFLFYVYRRKGPAREFTDDYIRDEIADLSPGEAWEKLIPLTKLGQALAELDVELDVPEDVELLGIKAGRHNVQRLLYWHFAKMFWNPDLSFEENHHINFDWYHPRYAHRQSAEEVRDWCHESGLEIVRLHEEEAGLTVRAVKSAA